MLNNFASYIADNNYLDLILNMKDDVFEDDIYKRLAIFDKHDPKDSGNSYIFKKDKHSSKYKLLHHFQDSNFDTYFTTKFTTNLKLANEISAKLTCIKC